MRFKEIETNYLYVYKKTFSLKLVIWIVFYILIATCNLMPQKGKWQPEKIIDIEAWLNQLTNIHILRRNLTSRWVGFKQTHQLDGCTKIYAFGPAI
jgi:hypothetical protein